jgi:2-dehydro-3-deoxygluconokinase
MKRILCFGELLMRFSPRLNGEWLEQNTMPVYIGGAELNTATALARWGLPTAYCTTLPDHYLSREIIQYIQDKNIESRIFFSGSRIGNYYLPQGADLKNAGVIYDRAYSSFWELRPGQVDWDKVLEDVSWFNFSAISPSLNENLAKVCREGVKAASDKGITVSVDLNYRSRLWQYQKEPMEVMPQLLEYCDIIMGNIWAAEKMLGIKFSKVLQNNQASYIEQAMQTSRDIVSKFPKCRQVANTFRFDANEEVHYYATLYHDGKLFLSHEHHAASIIDKVGSGDAFMAGLIYGNIKHHLPQDIIDFAAAAAFNKLFIRGDATNASVEEIRKGNFNYDQI